MNIFGTKNKVKLIKAKDAEKALAPYMKKGNKNKESWWLMTEFFDEKANRVDEDIHNTNNKFYYLQQGQEKQKTSIDDFRNNNMIERYKNADVDALIKLRKQYNDVIKKLEYHSLQENRKVVEDLRIQKNRLETKLFVSQHDVRLINVYK